MKIPVHALDGNISHTTIKIKVLVKKYGLTILVDNDSTHSFLDSTPARKSDSLITPTQTP